MWIYSIPEYKEYHILDGWHFTFNDIRDQISTSQPTLISVSFWGTQHTLMALTARTHPHSLHADPITLGFLWLIFHNVFLCSYSPVFPQHEDYLPVHDGCPDQTLWDGLPSVACRPWIITAKHKARGLGSLSGDEGGMDIFSLYSCLQGPHLAVLVWDMVKKTQEKYMVWWRLIASVVM